MATIPQRGRGASPRPPERIAALRQRLRPVQRRLLDACRNAAARRGERLYAVGGAVRDLLRERRSNPDPAGAIDLDLALDGDVIALARSVARRTGAEPVIHDRFLTARLTLDGVAVDLARTRSERYPRPGALPRVRPASIEVDLARRDFTVNAMALVVTGPRRGGLLDPFGGVRDLEGGWIRILHDGAFRDDPTRLLRACRYAARLDARLAPGTARAAARDRGFLARLTAGRFGEAWRLLLADAAAAPALEAASRLRLHEVWLPGWRIAPRLRRAFEPASAHAWGVDPPLFFWALSGLGPADPAVLDALPVRCALTREERSALAAGRALRRVKAAIGRRESGLSRVASLLRPLPQAAHVAAYALWTGVAGHRLEAYLDSWRHVESPLAADDILALGVPRGPEVGGWLTRLRDARLDGDLPPGASGTAVAERWVRGSLGPAAATITGRRAGGRSRARSVQRARRRSRSRGSRR